MKISNLFDSVIRLLGFVVIKDPNKIQVVNMIQNSRHNEVRFMAHAGNLYIWDSFYATHKEIGDELGICGKDDSECYFGYLLYKRDQIVGPIDPPREIEYLLDIED